MRQIIVNRIRCILTRPMRRSRPNLPTWWCAPARVTGAPSAPSTSPSVRCFFAKLGPSWAASRPRALSRHCHRGRGHERGPRQAASLRRPRRARSVVLGRRERTRELALADHRPAKLLDDRGAARTLAGFGLAKTRFFADDHEVDLDGRGRALSSGLTDDTAHDTSCVMGDVKEIGAAELRQSLGRIAKRLERDGQPIILKVGRRRVGAIVSMRDFEERFALQEAAGRRAELVEQILSNRRKVSHDADAVLRALRER